MKDKSLHFTGNRIDHNNIETFIISFNAMQKIRRRRFINDWTALNNYEVHYNNPSNNANASNNSMYLLLPGGKQFNITDIKVIRNNSNSNSYLKKKNRIDFHNGDNTISLSIFGDTIRMNNQEINFEKLGGVLGYISLKKKTKKITYC